MVALFGYSNAYERQMMEDNSGQLRNSSKMSMMDSGRYALLLIVLLMESSTCKIYFM